MCVGDLVTWKPELPFLLTKDYGIVIEIVDEYLVGVLWCGSFQVYMEPVRYLELINVKTY